MKQEIYDSRVATTRRLATAINAVPKAERPAVFVSSSAVGFYGTSTSAEFDESSGQGDDYLAQVRTSQLATWWALSGSSLWQAACGTHANIRKPRACAGHACAGTCTCICAQGPPQPCKTVCIDDLIALPLQVCEDWEAAAQEAEARVVVVRNGIVLSKRGGALAKMIPIFALYGGALRGVLPVYLAVPKVERRAVLRVSCMQPQANKHRLPAVSIPWACPTYSIAASNACLPPLRRQAAASGILAAQAARSAAASSG